MSALLYNVQKKEKLFLYLNYIKISKVKYSV